MNYPTSAGIYILTFKDGQQYVGKAKNLRERLSSHMAYNGKTSGPLHKHWLKHKEPKIEYIECKSEADALQLEHEILSSGIFTLNSAKTYSNSEKAENWAKEIYNAMQDSANVENLDAKYVNIITLPKHLALQELLKMPLSELQSLKHFI